MKRTIVVSLLVVALAGTGCAGLSEGEQRMLSGGAGGAAGGALIGALAGNAALGAAIGGGVGMAGGFLTQRYRDHERRVFQQGVEAGRQQQ